VSGIIVASQQKPDERCNTVGLAELIARRQMHYIITHAVQCAIALLHL